MKGRIFYFALTCCLSGWMGCTAYASPEFLSGPTKLPQGQRGAYYLRLTSSGYGDANAYTKIAVRVPGLNYERSVDTSTFPFWFYDCDFTSPTYNFRADCNSDLVIDYRDYQIIYNAYGSVDTYPNWDPRADVDNDGEVSIFDFFVFQSTGSGRILTVPPPLFDPQSNEIRPVPWLAFVNLGVVSPSNNEFTIEVINSGYTRLRVNQLRSKGGGR